MLSRFQVNGKAANSLWLIFPTGPIHPLKLFHSNVSPPHQLPQRTPQTIKWKINRKHQLDLHAKFGKSKRTDPAIKNHPNGKVKKSHRWAMTQNGDPTYDNFSIGHHTTWTRIWPFHKWQWNGL
jgi:hypothetical protein